tara:strand:+ start:332 stop:646 length:315 start_codon:yes stop_codon:yes gene_type:complete
MLVLMTFLFLVSLATNVVLVWYVRRVILEIAPLHERTLTLRDRLEEYTQHIEGVYELPTFYGDLTLKDLLSHSREITGQVQNFETGFIFENEGEEFEEEAETEG